MHFMTTPPLKLRKLSWLTSRIEIIKKFSKILGNKLTKTTLVDKSETRSVEIWTNFEMQYKLLFILFETH